VWHGLGQRLVVRGPVASCLTVPGSPATGVGDRLAVVVPLPSSPHWLDPKPYTAGVSAALAGAACPTLARVSAPTVTRIALIPRDPITDPSAPGIWINNVSPSCIGSYLGRDSGVSSPDAANIGGIPRHAASPGRNLSDYAHKFEIIDSIRLADRRSGAFR